MAIGLVACGKGEENQKELETEVIASEAKDVDEESRQESEEPKKSEEAKESEETKETESSKETEETTNESKEVEQETDKEVEQQTEKESETQKETEKTTKESKEPSYTKVDDTMYAKSPVNVRSGPDKTYKTLGTLKKGQEVKRIGICDNGWGVIEFGGKEGYVSGNYLVKDKPVEKVAQTETPKATEETKKPKATEKQPKDTQPTQTQPPETKAKRPTIDESKFVLL